MKRRSFVAGGAAIAASSAVGKLARSRSTGDGARRTWNLLGPSHRYVIRLTGSAVIGDCCDPAAVGGADLTEQPWPPKHEPSERVAMILHGSERRRVSWKVAVSHQPDPLALHLARSGEGVPLEAEQRF